MEGKTKKEYLEQYAKYSELSNALLNKLLKLGITWSDIIENPNKVLDDVNRPGFVYYKYTVPFGKKWENQILRLIKDYEKDIGAKVNIPEHIVGYTDEKYYNWLTLFALEYVINEIVDYLVLGGIKNEINK